MKNKILFIAPKIPYPAVDGHTKSMYGFIKSTYDLGYNVDLICYSQKKNVDEKLKQICNTYLIDVETENNFIEAIKNLFSEVPYNLSKYIRKDLIKFLENHLQTNSYEFVIIFNAHMGWIVNYLKSKTNSKIILREENLELLIMEKFYKNQKNLLIKFYAWLQYKKLLKYEPKLCEKFDACFMISDNDKIKLLLLNKNVNAVVINSSVEDELFNLTKNKIDKYSIFHIGSLNWYPNLDGVKWFLEEIFPLIVQKEPLTKFYLYGSELPINVLLKDEIKNLLKKLKFLLEVKYKEKKALIEENRIKLTKQQELKNLLSTFKVKEERTISDIEILKKEIENIETQINLNKLTVEITPISLEKYSVKIADKTYEHHEKSKNVFLLKTSGSQTFFKSPLNSRKSSCSRTGISPYLYTLPYLKKIFSFCCFIFEKGIMKLLLLKIIKLFFDLLTSP